MRAQVDEVETTTKLRLPRPHPTPSPSQVPAGGQSIEWEEPVFKQKEPQEAEMLGCITLTSCPSFQRLEGGWAGPEGAPTWEWEGRWGGLQAPLLGLQGCRGTLGPGDTTSHWHPVGSL